MGGARSQAPSRPCWPRRDDYGHGRRWAAGDWRYDSAVCLRLLNNPGSRWATRHLAGSSATWALDLGYNYEIGDAGAANLARLTALTSLALSRTVCGRCSACVLGTLHGAFWTCAATGWARAADAFLHPSASCVLQGWTCLLAPRGM
jgi:hypothetical protein